MEELKFRGISLDTGKMTEGYGMVYNKAENIANIFHKQATNLMQASAIAPETISRFVRKYKNTEVWEGDVIEALAKNANGDYPLRYLVVYNESQDGFRLRWVGRINGDLIDKTGFYDEKIDNEWKIFKVVGNKFLNPELLKAEY